MKFRYISLKTGQEKELSEWRTKELRAHLEKNLPPGRIPIAELQSLLLDYTFSDGMRLMLHQAYPIFEYVAINGTLWPED